MRKLAWMHRGNGRLPATGSDEWWRHTFIIPWPFSADEDGHRPAIVLVTRPWWATTYALAKDYRDYVRWDREATAAQYATTHHDEAWHLIYDGFDKIRPQFPARL